MPTESQLKAQMQAAILKKKQTAASPLVRETGSAEPKPSELPSAQSAAPKTSHPALYQPILSESSQTQTKTIDTSFEATEAELTRTFFGRPIRVAISKKQVYFCVPDVLETSDGPEQQLKYSEIRQETEANKIISPVVKTMLFPSPGGSSEKLDAATAPDIITIIAKLKLTFPGPIEHWLTDTTKSLMILIG